MPLCLRATANDYIVTTQLPITPIASATPVTNGYTIPEVITLNLTCKKDAIEIDGLFTLTYTANIAANAVAGTYTDTTTISIYQGTTATGTAIYTTTPVVRLHHYPANGDTAVTETQAWQVALQYIGYPALPVTEATVNYTIVVTSTVTGGVTPIVYLQEYTVSAREIPDCDL